MLDSTDHRKGLWYKAYRNHMVKSGLRAHKEHSEELRPGSGGRLERCAMRMSRAPWGRAMIVLAAATIVTGAAVVGGRVLMSPAVGQAPAVVPVDTSKPWQPLPARRDCSARCGAAWEIRRHSVSEPFLDSIIQQTRSTRGTTGQLSTRARPPTPTSSMGSPWHRARR